jgi:uncharacterized membrane protein YphA (DoxX/SURF4 family)
LGAPLIIFGLFHAMKRGAMEGYIGTKLPFPKFTNYATMAWLATAGALTVTDFSLGDHFHPGPWMAVMFLATATAIFHRPTGPEDQEQVTAVLKHIVMAGGYIALALA